MLYASHIYDGVGLDIVAVDLFTGEATVFSTISKMNLETLASTPRQYPSLSRHCLTCAALHVLYSNTRKKVLHTTRTHPKYIRPKPMPCTDRCS